MLLCFDRILIVKARQTRKGKKHEKNEKSYFVHIELYYLYGNVNVYLFIR